MTPPLNENRRTPSARAMAAVYAMKEANLARIVSGGDFTTSEDDARIIDLHCPIDATLELLTRQREIDKLSPAAREHEQRDIDQEADRLRNQPNA